jgi:heme A synthase
LKPTRIVSNLVGLMLFVQVILGGSAVFGLADVRIHLVWGIVTFGVLIIATVYAARELGSKSTLFRTGVAAIADYVVQIVLGVTALATNNNAVVVVVHLTNAFVLGVLVTYLISFADSAEKASASLNPQARTPAPGTMRALSRDS